jgi:hypothetical protein
LCHMRMAIGADRTFPRTPQLAQCRQALAVAPAPPVEPPPPARPIDLAMSSVWRRHARRRALHATATPSHGATRRHPP